MEGLPRWIGFIDAADMTGPIPLIVDIKTTSNLRYAKTPEELSTNTQLLTYAKWALDQTGADKIAVRHVYIPSKQYKKKKPPIIPVQVEVTREQIEEHWLGCVQTVREMVALAGLEPNADDVEPNTLVCGQYGGCPYRKMCGLEPLEHKGETKVKKDLVSLLDGPPPSAGDRPMPVGAVGILPPDAPTRETPQADAPPVKMAKRVPKVKLDNLVEPMTSPVVPEVMPSPKVKPVLYVDCYPTKGGPGKPTLLEEWLAPICQRIADQHEIADWRLIRYEAKANLAAGIRESLDTLPPVLLVSSYASGADVFLDIVAPYAQDIVKALRG